VVSLVLLLGVGYFLYGYLDEHVINNSPLKIIDGPDVSHMGSYVYYDVKPTSHAVAGERYKVSLYEFDTFVSDNVISFSQEELNVSKKKDLNFKISSQKKSTYVGEDVSHIYSFKVISVEEEFMKQEALEEEARRQRFEALDFFDYESSVHHEVIVKLHGVRINICRAIFKVDENDKTVNGETYVLSITHEDERYSMEITFPLEARRASTKMIDVPRDSKAGQKILSDHEFDEIFKVEISRK